MLSGCTARQRLGANFDGAVFGFDAKTEPQCVQKCVDIYPDCVAVDFNLYSRGCYGHGAQTGVGRWQDNGCCNRYEIVACGGRSRA